MNKKQRTSISAKSSLKIVYHYVLLVIVCITIAVVIRAVVLWQENVYDPSHHLSLAVLQKGNVSKIITFNQDVPSMTILTMQDKHIAYANLAKNYGIMSDAFLTVSDDKTQNNDVAAMMLMVANINAETVQTNLTFFDSIRLFLFAKNVSSHDIFINTIDLKQQDTDTNSIIARALIDSDIVNESVSIQINNATGRSGIGQRLGKVLTNMGANVVDVSTARTIRPKTSISYYGATTYTLDRLQKKFHVIPVHLQNEQIANIIITIGEDKINTSLF